MARQRKTENYKKYGSKMGRPKGTSGIKKTVLKEKKRVKCNFTISEEAAEYVEKKAKQEGVSKSEMVNRAILYFSNIYLIEI